MHTHTDSCPFCGQDYEDGVNDGIEELVRLGQPRPTYLVREIKQNGAVVATRNIVGKPNPSEGFTRLLVAGHKDRTLEASVMDHGLHCPIFDAELMRKAKGRLGRH